jgi:hypothetical protein
MTRYWINTISREHVRLGVEGGFTQANHGRDTGIRRLTAGDWMAFYSPRTSYPGGEPLQAFTAIGVVAGDEVYQVAMTADFQPWRRNMRFLECREAPIREILDDMGFIGDRRHWGMIFRRGLFEVPEPDFWVIAKAMGVEEQLIAG